MHAVIKQLYDQEFYDDLIDLAELNLAMGDHENIVDRVLTLFYLGLTHRHKNACNKASDCFKEAIAICQFSAQKLDKFGSEVDPKICVDILWNLYLCQEEKDLKENCINTLSEIPENLREAKHWFAMGKLCLYTSRDEKARCYLLQALRLNPMSLQTLRYLVKLKTPMKDELTNKDYIKSCVENEALLVSLCQYVAAVHPLWSNHYPDGIRALTELDEQSRPGGKWVTIVCDLAETHHLACDDFSAIKLFHKLLHTWPAWTRNMDMYAYILYINTGKTDEKALANLCQVLMEQNPSSVEAWVAFGFLSLQQHMLNRAKVCCERIASFPYAPAYAHVLRSHVMYQIQRYEDMLETLLEYNQLVYFNVDVIQCLVYTNILMMRCKDAVQCLNAAFNDQTGYTDRLELLLAQVLLKQDPKNDKIYHLFQSVLKKDKRNVNAAIGFSNYCRHNNIPSEAIPVLRDILRENHDLQTFLELSNVYCCMDRRTEAIHILSEAIAFFPTSSLLKKRLNNVDRDSHLEMVPTFDVKRYFELPEY